VDDTEQSNESSNEAGTSDNENETDGTGAAPATPQDSTDDDLYSIRNFTI
jgi:hypothetical protein